MTNTLLIVGSVLIAIAALVHVVIFLLESILWSKPTVWRRFGVSSQTDAEVVRPMAFNQGFYNMFLAVGAGVGLVMLGSTNLVQAGVALIILSATSMVLASVVLITSSPKLARAALIQGLAPLLGTVLVVVALAAR